MTQATKTRAAPSKGYKGLGMEGFIANLVRATDRQGHR